MMSTGTVFVVRPRISREIARTFEFEPKPVDGQQYDFSASSVSLEIQLGKAVMAIDQRKVLTQCKPGDIVYLKPKLNVVRINNRIVMADVHPSLYESGRPSFRHIYKHGETKLTHVVWECYEPTDLSKLPYLYDLYIIDEHVKG